MTGHPLYELYKLINYRYYDKRIPEINFDSFDDDVCKEFIYNYFNAGGKCDAIQDLKEKSLNGRYSFRATHSVNLYLMGLVFYEEFKNIIDTQTHDIGNFEFSYIWFLICLYHDYASFMEDNLDNEKELGIKIQEDIKKLNCDFFKGTYSKKNIIEYYIFKKESRQEFDHGIVAGILLNRRLKYILNRAIKLSETETPEDFIYPEDNPLHWSIHQKKWFDFASSVIMKHNIWFKNSDCDNKEEIKNHPKPFVIDNNRRLIFDDNPLLFILCLLDTIEFFKINNNRSVKLESANILSGINLKLCDKTLCLTFSDDVMELYPHVHYSANSLISWMNVQVNRPTENSIEITWL